ncbi:MAG: ADYC domain-containing protein [Polyangiaceae bacterium]|jgi:hypothetical protein|nr:ADYC domain-containing protein [Polyangiaceae bacterium]
MAGAKEAGGVGSKVGEAKGASASRGVGFALTLAVAALVAGAVGGCEGPRLEAPDDAAAEATTPDDTRTAATPAGAAAELAAKRAACEGEGCDARGGVEASLMPGCAPGSPKCDPELNGLGVFVGLDGRFCLPSYGVARYCVRSFINGPDGVKVRLASYRGNGETLELSVTAWFRPEGFVLPQLNHLHSITTEKGRLVIKYRFAGIAQTPSPPIVVPDDKLHWVWLKFGTSPNIAVSNSYQVRFLRADSTFADGPEPREPVARYQVSFRHSSMNPEPSAPWLPLCTDKNGSALLSSVLGGREIDPKSAEMTENDDAVTLSCVSGAIDTCMTWGYAPWAGEADAKRASVFGACLQAKRAAYYVGQGDLGSYTKPGTRILLRDMFGIHNAPINDASLEAVWTPTGAKCFNWKNRRRPEMLPDGHPDDITMPACPPGVGLGFLSTGKSMLVAGGGPTD